MQVEALVHVDDAALVGVLDLFKHRALGGPVPTHLDQHVVEESHTVEDVPGITPGLLNRLLLQVIAGSQEMMVRL